MRASLAAICASSPWKGARAARVRPPADVRADQGRGALRSGRGAPGTGPTRTCTCRVSATGTRLAVPMYKKKIDEQSKWWWRVAIRWRNGCATMQKNMAAKKFLHFSSSLSAVLSVLARSKPLFSVLSPSNLFSFSLSLSITHTTYRHAAEGASASSASWARRRPVMERPPSTAPLVPDTPGTAPAPPLSLAHALSLGASTDNDSERAPPPAARDIGHAAQTLRQNAAAAESATTAAAASASAAARRRAAFEDLRRNMSNPAALEALDAARLWSVACRSQPMRADKPS